ncbi:tripartite tricarboxylate transporter substrate binding protein [Ramlibacter sp. RBP-2]|uniref:Tripartite tricarboxylate transporter substrate binding protein n=1 Tax=Ramlibacter lithotrophicus TaxID=2606681 RepID=A0A7X6DKX9_9BURK|nr:tripartite tricarboxylate transporter substrate binding protein [Ramlibacter lithotrophicus]NKE68898.1 tripartite tricarboxylate transporter substrate binding protein [Ramlibacter lithotrophicus]
MRIFKKLVGVLLALFASASFAQAYPSKPIKLVIGLSAGGPSDVMARTVALALGERLGQQVVVENRTGVGGNIAAEGVAKSPADGYTLLFGSSGPLAVSPTLFQKLAYDPLKDFAPVGLVANLPLVLAVPTSLPVHNVQELIALAKARPGALNYASAGNGGITHLAMELLKSEANVDIRHVPYKGTAAAMPDVVSGNVQMVMDGWSGVQPLVKAGKLRQIAVAVDKRLAVAPDVPTIAEHGFPGFNASPWYGILAPAGTPQPIVSKLSSELAAVMSSAALKEKFQSLGMEPLTSTPAEFAAFLRTENEKWAKVVKRSGAKAE